MLSPSPNNGCSMSSTMSKRIFPRDRTEDRDLTHNSNINMFCSSFERNFCGYSEFCHSSLADQSVDEGSSFIRRKKLGKTPSPCLSCSSDRSMGEPPRFSNENNSHIKYKHEVQLRMKLGKIPSPCLSCKSDRSMGEPPRFSNENSSHIRMKLEPGPSPSLSYRTDRSMGEPPRFSNENISHIKDLYSRLPKSYNMLKQARFGTELAQSYAGAGDQACDICTGKRMRAVKWCLTCSVAYCETHVRQHYTVVAMQRHQLRDMTGDPETRICHLHYRALEVFCKTDQIFICLLCGMEKHKDHDTVLAKGGIHAAEEKLSLIPHQSVIHLERMHIHRCIKELTAKVKSLERAESELSHLSKRFFRGLQEAPDVTSEFVEVAALGRRLDLGMLYDCRSDSFTTDVFLWEKNILSSMKLSIPRPQSDVRILDGDSLQDRITALDLSVSLRASVVSGMVEITGASEFINHPVQTQLQDRVTLHYRTSTRLDMLSHELLHKRFLLSLNGSTTATHVVVAVLYGSQGFFVFDSKKDRGTENTNLNDVFTKMIASSSEIDLLYRLTEKEKTASFIDGVVLQSSVDTVLQNAGAVPLKVWLYPLKNLDQSSACVVKDISQDQLYKAENVLEKLKMDISFSQTLLSVVVGHDVFTQFPAVKDALSEFSSLLQQYQSIFQRKLASCIKTIRDTGALEEEEKLQDLLDESNQSLFRSECRLHWLQKKNAQVTALIQCKSASIKILNNQNDLQRFVQDCQADKVLGFIFTSLEGEDPFLSALRQNNKSVNIKELYRILDTTQEILSDLHSFILKKTTSESIQETMFIAASVTDFCFPGSAIHLYQSGELVSRNVKLHIKPNPSEIIRVQQTRVTMKLQSLKTNTQYYRVEYRAVKEDRSPIDIKWRVISCTGENCVVSHLAPETHYQLRYSLMDSNEMTDYSQVTEFQTAYRDRPGAPTVLKPNKDSLYIAWQRAESDEDSPVLYYLVEYLEAGLEGWQSIQTEGPVCECRISLPYSTCYRARVSAVYRNGDISTPSDETKVPVRVWSIDLSKRKASIFLEVLRQTTKKCVKLRDCTEEESEVKSFLQCLSYISQLSVDPPQTLKESLHTWRKNMTAFLINLCLQGAIHQKDSILETVQKLPLLCFKTYREQSDFLLDLYSCVTDYEARTGQKVRPALQAVYQKHPEVWSLNLSEKKVSFFLEVLKLQTVKKAVELRGWSEEENEIRSLLQCLPYISKLSFVPLHPQRKCPQERRKRVRRFLLDLCLQAALHQNGKIQTIMERCFQTDKETSVFLLLLYNHIRSYEAQEGRSVLPALQSVYSSLPKIWFINLSNKNASLFLEVLKLQPVKKAVELTGWSEDESEMKILLQCLPYISQLRFGFGLHGKRRQKTTLQFLVKLIAGATECSAETGENFTELFVSLCSFRSFSFSGEDEEFDSVAHCNLLLDLYLHAKDYESETCRSVLPALRSVYESLPEVWTISLMDKKALLFLEVLKLQTVKKVVQLTGWSNEKRKVRSFIQCLPHISQLRLCSDILVKMPQRKFLRSHTLVALEELLLTERSTKKPERMTCKILTRLQFLLRHWKIQRLNLTEYKMADESLLDLLNHQGPLTVRFSEETLQKLATVVYELQDEELTRRFLQNISGDLSSCSLSWDGIHWFLQHHTITVDIRKSTIYQENLQDLLLVLDKVQLRGLKSSFVLSVMRKLYETGSAHNVSSLLNSTKKCINLENRELNSVDCAALRFTLQHCTGVFLNLLWASVPEGELQSIIPLLSHVSHLRLDRLLLLRLLHCCNIPELQKEAAVLLSALHHKLDFSCQDALDLTADTTTFSLVLSSDDCRIISMAIQRAHIHIQLVILDCEMEEAAVEELFPVLHTVTLHCSKALLLRFLSHVDLGSEEECMRRAMALSQALRDKVDLSETQLNMQACKSLALVLEYSEDLSQLDLSHCRISDDQLELLMPQLHKTCILDLSNNHITDVAARKIYNVLSIISNIQTVCLFNNRITDPSLFLQDKRFEIW